MAEEDAPRFRSGGDAAALDIPARPSRPRLHAHNTHLELLEGEATAETSLEVVALGLGAHDGPQGTRSRAGEDGLGLLLAENCNGSC